MGDNFRPSLERGTAFGLEVFNGPSTRRRMSMGMDAARESEQDRDPEGQVEDFDELVRCAESLSLLFCPSCTADSYCNPLGGQALPV